MLPSLLLILSSLVAPQSARAGVWLQVAGVGYQDSITDPNGNSSNDLRVFSASSVGWAFPQGFFVGGELVTSRATASGGPARWAAGPKAGLLIKGFELTAAYLVAARESAPSGELKGSGYGVNAGYSLKLKGAFRLGFLVSYWSVIYSTLDGSELPQKPRYAALAPQISLGLDF